MKHNLVKQKGGPDIEIESLDRDGLLALHVRLSKKSAEIRKELDLAEAAGANGSHVDPKWMASTRSALAITATQLNLIQLRLSRLKATRRSEHLKATVYRIRDEHIAFLHAFFREAKTRLGSDDFKAMCEAAKLGQAELTCEKCGHAASEVKP